MSPTAPFLIHDDRFWAILGESPTLDLLAEREAYPFAHEAGVFIPSRHELYITSNRINDPSDGQRVQITRVIFDSNNPSGPVTCDELSLPIPMANGGVNYKDGFLICAQGSMVASSGLYYVQASAPYKTTVMKTDFHGRPFNSVNDVVVHSDGTIWFTDPTYGYEQGYRPPPRLPSQVYRYNPDNGSIRAMADGFGKPNGVCFSPDEKVVYVTDTDWMRGDGTTDDTRVSSM